MSITVYKEKSPRNLGEKFENEDLSLGTTSVTLVQS